MAAISVTREMTTLILTGTAYRMTATAARMITTLTSWMEIATEFRTPVTTV